MEVTITKSAIDILRDVHVSDRQMRAMHTKLAPHFKALEEKLWENIAEKLAGPDNRCITMTEAPKCGPGPCRTQGVRAKRTAPEG